VAIIGAAVFWLIATAIDLTVGIIFFNAEDLPNHLGEALVLNLMILRCGRSSASVSVCSSAVS
jgi:hypothetical protein